MNKVTENKNFSRTYCLAMMMAVSTSTTSMNIDKILGTSGEALIISLTKSKEYWSKFCCKFGWIKILIVVAVYCYHYQKLVFQLLTIAISMLEKHVIKMLNQKWFHPIVNQLMHKNYGKYFSIMSKLIIFQSQTSIISVLKSKK